MSKKNKSKPHPSAIKPKLAQDRLTATVAVSPGPLSKSELPLPTPAQSHATGPFLIRFDSRVRWFVGICVGLFFLLTLLKLHGSSVAMWNQIVPDGSDPQRGIVSGRAKAIRIDEYGVLT
ncbi:DUF7657 domain-containing protein, partial [Corallococcus praedator]|uniref:DUF7657 domain-containing protein n=1 Tax=Corallococcus praedator TaxID=2316724 RepID=UPI001ABF5867